MVKGGGGLCSKLVICPVFVAREVSGAMFLLERGIAWIGHEYTRGYAGCVSKTFSAVPNVRN